MNSDEGIWAKNKTKKCYQVRKIRVSNPDEHVRYRDTVYTFVVLQDNFLPLMFCCIE